MKIFKFKFVLITILTLICFFAGGLFYVVKTKIKEEEIRLIAIEKIREVFPKANIELGKLDIGVGLNISIYIDKFRLDLPRKNKTVEMVSVKDFALKLPILSVLTGQGNIEVILNDPQFTYLELDKKNNWLLAMGDNIEARRPQPQEKNQQVKADEENNLMFISPFIANSNIDLKFKNVLIRYDLNGGKAGNIKIDQFTVKDLGLRTPTAYELESNLTLFLSEKEGDSDEVPKLNLDVLLIGQFFLKDFFKNGVMESRAHLKVSNITSPFFSHLFQKGHSIKSNMNLKLSRNGELQGQIDSNFAKNIAKLNFSIQQSKINFSNLEIKLLINEFVNNSEIFSNSSESFFNIKGNLVIEDGKLHPNLSFSTDSEISLNFEKERFVAGLEGSLVKNNFSSEAKIKFLDGEGKVSLAGEIDLNSQRPFHEKVKNYTCKIDLSDMKLKRPFIQSVFYSQNNKEKNNPSSNKKISSVKEEAVSENLFLLPKGLVSLQWRDLEIGEQSFSGRGKWQIHLNRVKTNSMNFKYGAGTGSFLHDTSMHKNSIKSKFNLKMKNLNLGGLVDLFPPNIPELEGNLGGESRGFISVGESFQHDINVNFNVLKGKFKEVDIRPYIQKILDVVTKVPTLKNKVDSGAEIGLNGDFEKIRLKGRFRQDHYRLSEFAFQGIKNRLQLDARGNIYPNDKSKNGVVYVDLKETKIISPQLKKQTQTGALPMLFKGPQLSLTPDYSYSLKKLAKSHLKKRKSKLVKDSKEKAKSKLDDLLKGEGKKILKKFF